MGHCISNSEKNKIQLNGITKETNFVDISKYISQNDIKIETDRYYDNENKEIEAVKLTQISTGLQVAVHSCKSKIHAYNTALKKLEEKYLNNA